MNNKSSRRKFISTAVILTAGSTTMAETLSMKTKNNKIAHQVYFWLKNPEDRQKLIEGVNTLKKIKTVRQIHVGIVAGTEKREVIDTSWGVSLLLFFDDIAGEASYQTDPIHLDFVKNYSNLWNKVVIYDAEMV
ncbi:MAG: stress responsive alpha-beta barrel domain-containing protein [Sphingobacteriales bacterium 17-39-43]|uniref:Dabb family protein n=1 Tax=Daejeonella sp. TaxID=2805397 RepID=UPI000BC7DFDA|nr:Dabb family protein [Daejeonella sp.]OYZ32475.1 MAG: stress responsive alpha-beta barrel domain-containing protein [Sphingobacteriales bacterium 16-39-50]OZA25838.1 MAG: stress responsive alpha-beta barrel domain-containing protein [Sphingobacteriales bacterium 17-39-43]HQT21965.1 Dabb family protein [Daejeonella sp.]HQT57272.1 Dabb family protein [Daejeonella sp.]